MEFNMWPPKINVTTLVSDQIESAQHLCIYSWIMVLNSSQKGCFCKTLACHSEAELSPFGYKMTPANHFIQLDICVKFIQMNQLVATPPTHTHKNNHDVTEIFDYQILITMLISKRTFKTGGMKFPPSVPEILHSQE